MTTYDALEKLDPLFRPIRIIHHPHSRVLEVAMPSSVAHTRATLVMGLNEKVGLLLGSFISCRGYFLNKTLRIMIHPVDLDPDSPRAYVVDESGNASEFTPSMIAKISPVAFIEGRVYEPPRQSTRGRISKTTSPCERDFIEKMKSILGSFYVPRYCRWDPEIGIFSIALIPRLKSVTQVSDPCAYISQVYKKARSGREPRRVTLSKRAKSENRIFRISVPDEDVRNFFGPNQYFLAWNMEKGSKFAP